MAGRYKWYQKAGSLVFAIFCFELGLFLVVFPWLHHWTVNYFALLTPESYEQASWYEWWRHTWNSGYFRGAVSGLGLVNIYIALHAIAGLRRFSEADGTDPEDNSLE
ncbi:MAG: hypothetical protein FJW39_03690 [Acidobacteria bacterium]|nr:hypothetical protein [Acidobacteriota bacterium]